MNLTVALNASFQGPGGGNVAQSVGINQATYGAQSQGSIDVPSGTASGTAFVVPFGSVATPIGALFMGRNMGAGVFYNGQTGGSPSPIPTGGFAGFAGPQSGPVAGLSSAVVVTIRQQQGPGQIDYLIFGD